MKNSHFMRPLVKIVGSLIMGGSVFAMAGCESGIAGTYRNSSGMVTLDLRSGGKAALTVLGENEPCTYEVDGKNMSLTCKGNKTTWDIHDDGSISGPGFVGSLTKNKS
jgi:hypothetical protein